MNDGMGTLTLYKLIKNLQSILGESRFINDKYELFR